jgi:hypothetical protein
MTKYDMERRLYRKNKWIYVSGIDVVNRAVWNHPCCYVIYCNGILSYIGQTNTPITRFHQHDFSWKSSESVFCTPWGNFKEMFAKIYFPSKYGYEAMLEKRLIKKIKPRFNKYTYKRKRNVSMI